MKRLPDKIALFFAITLSAVTFSREAAAHTDVYPPGSWGHDKLIVLVGVITGGSNIYATYYNNESGSGNYEKCSFVLLSTAGALNDDYTVHAETGADIMYGDRAFSVQCLIGGSYTAVEIYHHQSNTNGFFLDMDGSSGNDEFYTSLVSPSFSWGGSGNDKMVGYYELPVLLGEAGNDNLRAVNNLYNGSDQRILSGGADQDCLEDNVGTPTNQSVIDCGGQTDISSIFTASPVSPSQCESTTSNHCFCVTGESSNCTP